VQALRILDRRSPLYLVREVSGNIMALKMGRDCPHCGEELVVAFKRDLSQPGAPLMGAVSHGIYDMDMKWVPITGFEDALRLPAPEWVGKPDANGDIPCSRLAPKRCMWVEGHYGGCATR
jgi:hypothetical protein